MKVSNYELTARSNGIDSLRLFFAFCVVIIHVPVFGGNRIWPLLRCAVPFFYIVSGYFAYNPSESDFKSKLFCLSKKWFSLWLTYFSIITVCSLILHYLYNQPLSIRIIDVLSIFSGAGTCLSLDAINIGSRTYGLYTLWFLLSGSYTFLVLGFFSKSVIKHSKQLLVFILMFGVATTVYELCVHHIFIAELRQISLAFPFVTLGILLHKYIDIISGKIKGWHVSLLFLMLFLEQLIWRSIGIINNESFITAYMFVPALFIWSMGGGGDKNELQYFTAVS